MCFIGVQRIMHVHVYTPASVYIYIIESNHIQSYLDMMWKSDLLMMMTTPYWSYTHITLFTYFVHIIASSSKSP